MHNNSRLAYLVFNSVLSLHIYKSIKKVSVIVDRSLQWSVFLLRAQICLLSTSSNGASVLDKSASHVHVAQSLTATSSKNFSCWTFIAYCLYFSSPICSCSKCWTEKENIKIYVICIIKTFSLFFSPQLEKNVSPK